MPPLPLRPAIGGLPRLDLGDLPHQLPGYMIQTDALGVVARARGMSQPAEETGLTRQALYKALSGDGNPEFATSLKVIRALGLRLHPEPASAA